MFTLPENVIAAVTHPDPYPFYAALIAEKPIYYDESLRLWMAASAEAATAVLTSDLCRVRPATEPIPHVLAGSTAGKIFGALVRMNDGQTHCPLKKAVSITLDHLDPSTVFEVSLRHAQTLAAQYSPHHLTDLTFDLPAYVMASLLGIPDHYLSQIARWMSDFVYCLSPISTPQQIEQGKQTAEQLINRVGHLLTEQQTRGASTLLVHLFQNLSQQGITDNAVVIANAIGFISQSYEATAGLIGNALLVLSSHPKLYQELSADLRLINHFVPEVARFDSPVQNTRRFLSADGLIAGQAMKAGDAVLVLLAAANRDPAVNTQPDTFDIHRQEPTCFTFGLGIHACPGQSLAEIIACAALQHLITSGIDIAVLPKPVTYRRSTNTRIPLLNQEKSS
jgi:cytochrome P450